MLQAGGLRLRWDAAREHFYVENLFVCQGCSCPSMLFLLEGTLSPAIEDLRKLARSQTIDSVACFHIGFSKSVPSDVEVDRGGNTHTRPARAEGHVHLST